VAVYLFDAWPHSLQDSSLSGSDTCGILEPLLLRDRSITNERQLQILSFRNTSQSGCHAVQQILKLCSAVENSQIRKEANHLPYSSLFSCNLSHVLCVRTRRMPLIGGNSPSNMYFFETMRRSFLVQNEEEPNVHSNRAARHEDRLPSHDFVTPRAKLERARQVSTDHEEGPSEEAEAPSVQVPFPQTIPSVKLLATHRTECGVDIQNLTVSTEDTFEDEALLFAASEERQEHLADLDIEERGREPPPKKEKETEEAARKGQAERRPETGDEKSEQTCAVEKEAEVALEEVAKAIERLDKFQVDLQVHGWCSRTESMFRSERDAADRVGSGPADSEQGAQKDAVEPAGERISDEGKVKKKKKKKEKGESSNR
jgi:hypothetical protein